MKENTCRIWGTRAAVHHQFDYGSDKVDSPRAGGLYVINHEARDDYFENPGRLDEQTKARLTTWLIDQRRFGVECPEITHEIVEETKRRRALSVQERADKLLEHLASRSEFAGDKIPIEKPGSLLDMLAWSESIKDDEVEFLLDYLNERKFILQKHTSDDASEVKVTIDGYAHLAELRRKAVDSKQAFVAMWFGDSMKTAYEDGIEPAIRSAGYDPMRIDRKEHLNKIDDEIIAEIRRSRFLVSDFTQGDTGARGGVYYEAGFAHGLNLPVIFTCHKDAFEKVHLDTRQYNHIVWETPEELRDKLAKRISATIGDGPLRKRA